MSALPGESLALDAEPVPAHHALPASTSVAAPSHDRTPTPRATKAAIPPPPPPSHAAAASAAPTAPGGARSHPSASPSPSLRGLCIEYLANEITGGKRMDNPAFGALVTAAGGKNKITIYCLTLLRADRQPTRPARSDSIGPPILSPGHRLSGPPDVPPSGPEGDQS